MRNRWIGSAVACAMFSGCLSNSTSGLLDRAFGEATARLEAHPASSSPSESPSTRDRIIGLALERDPSIRAMAHRSRAMVHEAHSLASLPAPEIEAQIWNLPAARPYAVGDADMLMIELRQAIPSAGLLDARARSRANEAGSMLHVLRSEEQRVAREIDIELAHLHHARETIRLHDEHRELLENMRRAAEARLSTGAAAISELARIEFEGASIHRELANAHVEFEEALHLLNTRLGRDLDSPVDLGIADEVRDRALSASPTLDVVFERAQRRNAAFGQATADIARAQAFDDEAAAMRRPEFMVGLGYWQDPEMAPGIGASVSMTLPWFVSGPRRAQDGTRENLGAARADAEATTRDVRLAIVERYANWKRARDALAVLRERVIPAADAAAQGAEAAFSISGNLAEFLDAAKMRLEAKMEENDRIFELIVSHARLEELAGGAL